MKKTLTPNFLCLMKCFGLALGILVCSNLNLRAQEIRTTNPSAEAAPGVQPSGEDASSPEALYDVQFNYNITNLAKSSGWAGVTFVQNKFWLSKWQSDTIMQVSRNGALISKFIIPGLTGVRAFTTDGTYIYAATNTTTIYRIDTAARVLAPPHINSASANNVRHMSYDPTLNSNAGGFWVGNFSTDIDAISMSGAVISSIPAATHGLSGMYGSAYDGYTAGGPYLWVFTQMMPNNTQIERITLSTGAVTPSASRDVFADFSASNNLTSGLAGGLFIAGGIVPGKWTLGGLIQGSPNNVLFGYELNDLVLVNDDAAAAGLRPVKGYTQIPASQVFAENFSVQASNLGGAPIGVLRVDFSVKFNGGATVFTNTQATNNLGSGQSATLTSAPFLPANGAGTYDVMAIASPVGGNDPRHANDTAFFRFLVTDSTFSRDDGRPSGGGYTVSSTSRAFATTNFELTQAARLTSITIELATPVAGDTTYAVVTTTFNGIPDGVIYRGPAQIIGSGTTMVLPVPGGILLPPFLYGFGCYEGANTGISLAQSPNLYTPGVNAFFTPAGGWQASGIQTARFIRPNFGRTSGVAIENEFESGINIFPNPGRDKFIVAFSDQVDTDVNISLLSPVGQVLRSMVVNPGQQQAVLDLAGESIGIYFIRIHNGTHSTVRKVVLAQ